MSLEREKFILNLAQGVDTKTDDKVLPPGKLTLLENGVFKKNGRLDKRFGTSAVVDEVLGSDDTLSGSNGLTAFKNELLQYNNQRIYALAEGASKWIDKGPFVSVAVNTSQIVSNTASQSQCDYAAKNGVSVYTWVDTRAGFSTRRASVVDDESGTTIISDYQLTGTIVKCISFKQWIVIFSQSGSSLYSYLVDSENPLSITQNSNANFVATVGAIVSSVFEIYNYRDEKILIAFKNSTSSNQIKLCWLDENMQVYTGSYAPFNVTTSNPVDVVSLSSSQADSIFLLYHETVSNLNLCVIFNSLGAVSHTAFAISSGLTALAPRHISPYPLSDESGIGVFADNYDSGFSKYIDLRHIIINNNGTLRGDNTTITQGVSLYSRAFAYNPSGSTESHGYVAVAYQSELQSTYFVIRDDGLVVAKIKYALGGGHGNTNFLTNVSDIGDGVFGLAILNKTRLISENKNVFSLQGISRTTIDFEPEDKLPAVQLGDNLHLAGGILSMYDGESVVEHGFHLYPEGMSSSLIGAGNVDSGDHNYVALYEWIDRSGQIHRSAPSVPLSVTSSGSQVSLKVPYLNFTHKTATWGRTEVSIVIYRTVKGPGATYYRVSSITSPTANNPTGQTVDIVDNTSDSNLISNEILYTTGGVLENFAPPACRHIAVFNNRLFLTGLENENEIWYSKQHTSGEPVEFAAELTLSAPSDGGPIYCGEALEDRFIIFKGDRAFFTYGDGPNNAGVGGEFPRPERIPIDVGCRRPSSLLPIPNGLMFKSDKGFYLLDVGLSARNIGAEVEDFNSAQISAGVMLPKYNQIRYTSSDNSMLVYDYYVNQWSTFSLINCSDCLVWKDKFYFLNESGIANYEDDSTFVDSSIYQSPTPTPYSLQLITGWITLDTIVGLQRIFKLSVIGTYRSPHTLRLSVAYDYNTEWVDTFDFDTTTDLDVDNVYRFVVSLTQQKCQAIKIKVEDLEASLTAGSCEGYSINGIGILAGIKGKVGVFRTQQKIGGVME